MILSHLNIRLTTGWFYWLAAGPCLLIGCLQLAAEEPRFSDEQLAFFEREVKPILKANCVNCHGAEKKVQSELYLTSRDGFLKGGENGPAISLENPSASEFLAAIRYESFEMPPKGKLPQAQINVLTRWVEMGLPWPEGEAGNLIQHGPPVVDETARNFWAFRPVVRPEIPAVQDAEWVRTPLDAFILAKLEGKGLKPAPPADKTTLLRRAHYAVTGLPPTPSQVAAFLADESPDAYDKVVAELLDSRHYGEHWGRHWLDLVRYAESNSFERDNPKPFVWRYRDYVIRSLNEDKPYGQFIREQLAGDELDEITADSIIATGYYRLGLWDDEPADPLLAYYDGLDDIIAATGQTFLGLTINCARCHDHKIDPIPQSDYYKLVAFFRGIRHYGQRSDESVATASLRSIATPEQQAAHQEQIAAHAQQIADLDRQLGKIEAAVADKLPGGERDDFKYPRNRVSILRKHVGGLVTREAFDQYSQLRRQRDRLERDRPRSAEKALAVTEESQVPETYVLLRGNPQSHGDRVEPGFPAVMTAPGAAAPAIEPLPADRGSSGRRRVLAAWIADPANPLTTRVMANRVFQYHFGRGIVRSSSNFGYMGTPPTHPDLLDWLAAEFAESGMRLKHLHRLILTSNAFRMSGQLDPEAVKVDPENDLLSHFDLRRLTAEEVRDSILAACGNLNLDKQEGPSVYPVIPQEVLAGQSQPGRNWERSTPEEAAARSVFVHIKRSLAVPILAAFDAPDPDAPCPVRFSTTQPTQALGMLNSQFLNEQAQIFADRTRKGAGADPQSQVAFVLRQVLQREPKLAEVDRGVTFLRRVQSEDSSSPDEALRQFCLLALNLNEFVYLE
ncbi:MAG: PSD1 and planctomycete cytochrome C domain-containing protein [Pirellulaceae bacterium]|nr:PSD1 and planctomycete cytochrome C domain-containing protein [Pirellulaceae bacterium]